MRRRRDDEAVHDATHARTHVRTPARARAPWRRGGERLRRARRAAGCALVVVGLGLPAAPLALAAGGGGGVRATDRAMPPAYQKGLDLVADGDFGAARAAFEQANRKKRNDPDILNMLAYTQRKTGQTEIAIENYRKALRLRPDFPDAREYLGEAYLQAALEQLQKLADDGAAASEQHGQLLRALQDGTRELAPPKSAKW